MAATARALSAVPAARAVAPRPASKPARPPRREQEEVRPPLVVVAPRGRRRVGVVLTAMCGVLFVGMLGLTGLQARIAQDQQRIDRLDRELQQARAYYDELRVAVAAMEAPDFVVPRAEAMGMVPVVAPAYLTPSAEELQAVVVAAGSASGVVDDGAGTREDWKEVKGLTGRVP